MPPKKGGPPVPAAKADSQTLPPMFQPTFKQILKLYEDKQYKKAIKSTETILKKFPNHGETLAMKALITNATRKRDDNAKKAEAIDLAKRALELNMNSQVSWHVLGLIRRSDREYSEAIQAYRMALSKDPNKLEILRDLAQLQIQCRLVKEFTETRLQILTLKPSNKNNWIAYAIGNHLSANYPKCLTILDAYSKTAEEDKGSSAGYETSELQLYRNWVIEESGDFQRALTHLNENSSKMADGLYVRETKGRLLQKLGRPAESEEEYRALLQMNADNLVYHHGLARALGLPVDDQCTNEQRQSLDAVYRELLALYPNSLVVKRRPLDFLVGDAFKAKLDPFLKAAIRSGIPTIFRELKHLYKDPAKVAAIESLLLAWVAELSSNNRFAAADPVGSESPAVLLFALEYMAAHYDYIGQPLKALDAANQAIKHSPTALDLYVVKARIYKHAGDHLSAYGFMDHARRLDTQDRYLNTKCVRYALRANKIKEAEETVALFLRDGDNLVSLYDMQASWYELALGDCLTRTGQTGKALKQYTNIDKHFEAITEDQFDFHSYCLRKSTLRAYVKCLRWEDRLRSHRFFVRACQRIVQIYIKLADKPKEDQEALEAELAGLPEEERKRIEKKKKREANANRVKEEEQAVKKENTKPGQNKNPARKSGDEDPDGETLLKKPQPIEEATKWLSQLQLYFNDNIDTQLLAVQVYSRKSKFLLWLRALKKAVSLDQERQQTEKAPHPLLHVALSTFVHDVDTAALDPVVKQVIDSERKEGILVGWSKETLAARNDAFIASFSQTSLLHKLAGARVLLLVNKSSETRKRVVQLLSIKTATKNRFTIQECTEALSIIAECDTDAVQSFKASCAELFPLTPAFMTQDSVDRITTEFGKFSLWCSEEGDVRLL